MTCIVGYVDNGNVYIGGDSAGVDGFDVTIRTDKKIFGNNDFIFGFTSSFRMGQILKYNFLPPKREEDISDDEYIYKHFIIEIIKVLKENSYAEVENNQVKGGEFLFGYRGKLYYVGSDFQVGGSINNYDAIGCGAKYAKGCLFALQKINMGVEKRIKLALEAAETFSAGVHRPFEIIKL